MLDLMTKGPGLSTLGIKNINNLEAFRGEVVLASRLLTFIKTNQKNKKRQQNILFQLKPIKSYMA